MIYIATAILLAICGYRLGGAGRLRGIYIGLGSSFVFWDFLNKAALNPGLLPVQSDFWILILPAFGSAAFGAFFFKAGMWLRGRLGGNNNKADKKGDGSKERGVNKSRVEPGFKKTKNNSGPGQNRARPKGRKKSTGGRSGVDKTGRDGLAGNEGGESLYVRTLPGRWPSRQAAATVSAAKQKGGNPWWPWPRPAVKSSK